MSDRVRSTKLTFKGEKHKKKKRKHKQEAGDENDVMDPQAWVQPDNAMQVYGPTFILHPSSPPICITYDSTRSRIMLHTVTPEPGESPLTLSPTEVSQVWVVTRVSGAETVNLRTAEGKFLSCDTHGLVSADREARGPQEEWTPVVLEGGMVAFMNIYEKYLSMDEVAGGSLALRGDSDTVGFGERFWVKVQHEYKLKAGEEERKKEGVTGKRKIDEVEDKCVHESFAISLIFDSYGSHTFQAWGAGRSVVSSEDKTEVWILSTKVGNDIDPCQQLKRARKDGRLSEAMLDRRSKLKRCAMLYS